MRLFETKQQAYEDIRSNNMKEEAITSGDQLTVIRQWLEYMEAVEKTNGWSYGEIIEVQSVYDIVKDNEY